MIATVEWLTTPEKPRELAPYVMQGEKRVRVGWAPQPGSQVDFLESLVTEVLYGGTRGPGKTEALLMAFAQHTGPDTRTPEEIASGVLQWQGFGSYWCGIIFRQNHKDLKNLIKKSLRLFPKLFPGIKYNRTDKVWTWPTGESLTFAIGEKESDYWRYHGDEFTFLGFEELTTWADPGFYNMMISCLRCTVVPEYLLKVRSTTNPGGPGHNWVKDRFNCHIPPEGETCGPIIKDEREEIPEDEREPDRQYIHGRLSENKVLLTAQPNYAGKVRASAPNKNIEAAWMDGRWDIVAGGMFDDLWEDESHIMPDIIDCIPATWRIDRSFDWGSTAPFSVGWWAESDGTDIKMPNGNVYSTVRGDLFRIAEWYGWDGSPNQGLKMLAKDIAKGIIEREIKWGLHGRVKAGPADSAIFAAENGMSISIDMMHAVTINGKKYPGIVWLPADKRPGSRKTGWELFREYLSNAKRTGLPRERPGLFICQRCAQFIRTIPTLPRDLKKDPDDVNTDAEDHIADEARYRIRFSGQRGATGRTVGMGA